MQISACDTDRFSLSLSFSLPGHEPELSARPRGMIYCRNKSHYRALIAKGSLQSRVVPRQWATLQGAAEYCTTIRPCDGFGIGSTAIFGGKSVHRHPTSRPTSTSSECPQCRTRQPTLRLFLVPWSCRISRWTRDDIDVGDDGPLFLVVLTLRDAQTMARVASFSFSIASSNNFAESSFWL